MRKTTNEETLPLFDPDMGGTPAPATKRATKKSTAAKKTAAKKTAVAKKTASAPAPQVEEVIPVAPVVAKKAAKKAARKVATKEIVVALTAAPEPPPVEESAAPAPKKKTARARKSIVADISPIEALAAEPAPPAAPALADTSPAPTRRVGRVPGGGRTAAAIAAAAGTPQPVTPQPTIPQAPPAAPAPQPQEESPADAAARESRSKRRREKRKRRAEMRKNQGLPNPPSPPNQAPARHAPNPPPSNHPGPAPRHAHQPFPPQKRNGPGKPSRFSEPEAPERRPQPLTGPKIETDGMLELAPKGFGFLRTPSNNFDQARDDVFVPPEMIRKYNLRLGQWIHGLCQEGPRGAQLVEITTINDLTPDQSAKLPHFEELKAINPAKRISFETTPERFTTRVLDIMAPVGRGQRGLIVSPPRSGKTTLLLHMAEAVREKYEDSLHLMVLLVDERPEEVTEFRRALPGVEIYASSNDEQPRNHCRIAELAIERAKRLVEAGKDVFLLMDSITRLARAYNNASSTQRGRATGSGGIMIGALEIPRRLFAAARNTRGGGSLTILATALIQTNSRADEAIFMEFKGTGNMELILDRKIAENYIYPAVDIFKSGTRREELLLPEHMLHKIHLIRRGLSGHRPVEAMERLLFFLKKFPNNPQMLLEIKG